MKKIAVIEKIHQDGLDFLEKSGIRVWINNRCFWRKFNKKLPEFDGCTLRVSKLNENILKIVPIWKLFLDMD